MGGGAESVWCRGLVCEPHCHGEKTVEMAQGFSPYGPEPFSGVRWEYSTCLISIIDYSMCDLEQAKVITK